MREAVIVGAARTPCCKRGAQLAPLVAEEIASFAIKAAIERAGVDPAEIEEVFYGNTNGADMKCASRAAALEGGLPFSVPTLTFERGCASALSAICVAATYILSGQGDIYLAGGMESTSHAPFIMERQLKAPTTPPKWLTGRFINIHGEDCSMGQSAENVANLLGITREECDAFALESQLRAAAATNAGYFRSQIAPVSVTVKGSTTIVDKDEIIRPETTMEGLGKLKPSFGKDGVCTAGNSSPFTDGASAVVVMEKEAAKARGLKILGTLKGFCAAGRDPKTMGLGPVDATTKLLARMGLTLDDIDLIELNEAFASQAIGCVRQLGLDMNKVNVNGGAIALGHPFGATGGVLTTKLLYEMERRGLHRGLVTFCIGGGQGFSAIFEREE